MYKRVRKAEAKERRFAGIERRFQAELQENERQKQYEVELRLMKVRI